MGLQFRARPDRNVVLDDREMADLDVGPDLGSVGDASGLGDAGTGMNRHRYV